MRNTDKKLIEWLEAQCPIAYLDAVDESHVCVAPRRKNWLDIQDDKDFLSFHRAHAYDNPLYVGQPFSSSEEGTHADS
jgi:hypothetical protein